jgi:hypothetical protein
MFINKIKEKNTKYASKTQRKIKDKKNCELSSSIIVKVLPNKTNLIFIAISLQVQIHVHDLRPVLVGGV